jgi:hypothetical protein
MKGSDYMLLAMTFVVGAFAGGYLYITVYAPQEAERELARSQMDWEVVGRTIGGCQLSGSCPEVYVASDRSFTYSPDGVALERGRIPRALRADIQAALQAEDRAQYDRVGDTCRAAADGTDYEYDIDAYDEQFAVTTCGTQFANSDLAVALEAVWAHVSTANTTSTPLFIEEGLQGWLEAELDKRFQYDD